MSLLTVPTGETRRCPLEGNEKTPIHVIYGNEDRPHMFLLSPALIMIFAFVLSFVALNIIEKGRWD